MESRLNVGALGLALAMSLPALAPACVDRAAAPMPTLGPVVVLSATATAEATRVPTPVPSPAATPSTFLVGNTGGDGAFIRRTPGGDVIRAWPDAAEMVVVGRDNQTGGRMWKNVRDPDGNEGWVATEYLVKR